MRTLSISHLSASSWLAGTTRCCRRHRNTFNVGRQETNDEGRPDRRARRCEINLKLVGSQHCPLCGQPHVLQNCFWHTFWRWTRRPPPPPAQTSIKIELTTRCRLDSSFYSVSDRKFISNIASHLASILKTALNIFTAIYSNSQSYHPPPPT